MEWTDETISRLYKLHEQEVDLLRRDVARVNRELGASDASECKLEKLTRTEFEEILRNRDRDPEAAQLWIRRLIRGNEREFPGLLAAS